MGRHLTKAYLEALDLVVAADLARETDHALRTIQAYKQGTRGVTPRAGEELLAYLRKRSGDLTAAASALEAALEKEAHDG